MDLQKPTATAQPERTIGQLVAEVSNEVSGLVRAEIALAKAELKADAQRAAIGGAMFGVAGFLGLLSLITLLIAAAYGLTETGLPAWAAFLIVTAVLLLVAAVLAFVGKGRFSELAAPQRTIDTTKDSIAALKGDGPSAGV